MPNHCSQDLTVRGPTDEIARFLEECTTPCEHPNPPGLEEQLAGARILDCNKVIPYPLEYRLQDELAKAARDAYAALPDDVRKATPYPDIKDGFNSGGVDWCYDVWGTKWGAYDPADYAYEPGPKTSKVTMTFHSAWGPLNGRIWPTLHERFPTLSFQLRYYESGMAFKGKITVKPKLGITRAQGDYRGSRGG